MFCVVLQLLLQKVPAVCLTCCSTSIVGDSGILDVRHCKRRRRQLLVLDMHPPSPAPSTQGQPLDVHPCCLLAAVHEALEAVTATQQKLLRHQERIEEGHWAPTRNEVAAASLKAASSSSAAAGGSKKNSVLARARQLAAQIGPGGRQGSGGVPGVPGTPRAIGGEEGSSSVANTPRARPSGAGTPRSLTPRAVGSSRMKPPSGAGEAKQEGGLGGMSGGRDTASAGSSRPCSQEVIAQRQLYMANLEELLQGTSGSVDALQQQLDTLEAKLLSVLGFYCELGASSSSSGATSGRGSARGQSNTSRSFNGSQSARKAPVPVDMDKVGHWDLACDTSCTYQQCMCNQVTSCTTQGEPHTCCMPPTSLLSTQYMMLSHITRLAMPTASIENCNSWLAACRTAPLHARTCPSHRPVSQPSCCAATCWCCLLLRSCGRCSP
jgi:hypothetical protein